MRETSRSCWGRLAGLLALAVAALVGCPKRSLIKGPGDPDWGVRVNWYGHSCFTVEDSVGRMFLIDPFDETVGYDLAWVDPDAVLVTHEHFDHDYLRHAVSYELVASTGVHTADGIEVAGVPGWHDDEQGARHGSTRFFAWEMGGLRFAHLGDVGQAALSPEQLEALGRVDVLFVPVGGRTTVDGAGAAAIVRQVGPRVAVPMHYGNRRVRFFEFDPADGFLRQFSLVQTLPEPDFQVRRADLPSELTVFVPAVPDRKR